MGAREDKPDAYTVGEAAWLSKGFEELLYGVKSGAIPQPYDVVIVGSGYGGSIAAAELAGCTHNGNPVSVCMLERGREYLPGMFPSRFSELPTHMRFSTPMSPAPRGRRDGLFDIRIGPDIHAVLGNGLGGGSLINAGVMARANADMFDGWPAGVSDALFADKDGYYQRAQDLVGATQPAFPKGKPAKLVALERLAANPGIQAKTATITAAPAGWKGEISYTGCCGCGDCATGCNEDAKISLDTTLLVKAWRNGAHIFTGATVLRIERKGDLWALHAAHTDDQLRKRQKDPAKLLARRVILAAGTYGSTEILLRSQSDSLKFSRYLGRSFSANGDAIAVVYDRGMAVNTVGNEDVAAGDRNVGPTICGILDLREGNGGHVIEEIAIPSALRRVFEEVVTTTKTLHELSKQDKDPHRPGQPQHDPCAVDRNAIQRTSAFVMMGNDGAKGALELIGGHDKHEGDGAVCVRWPALREDPLFGQQLDALQKLLDSSKGQGRVLPNPVWQLMPTDMQFLFGNRHGPLLTVHPLGGCRMGAHVDDGVVNDCGQVFRRAPARGEAALWDDLVVLDGSIVRNALGINPALTISALALRAVEKLRDERWGFARAKDAGARGIVRPRFRSPPAVQKIEPTRVRLVERMSGNVMLAGLTGNAVPCRVELTMRFHPKELGDMVLPRRQADGTYGDVAMARRLDVQKGKLRVFRKEKWDDWNRRGAPAEELDSMVEYSAKLGGTLTILDRAQTEADERTSKAWWAWVFNRGIRDSLQALCEHWRKGTLFDRATWVELGERRRSSNALASRAGEVRELRYVLDLKEGEQLPQSKLLDLSEWQHHRTVSGVKRLTYESAGNPWRQLMNMTLDSLPGKRAGKATLELDTKFLAGERVPLFEIVSQNDQVSALADIGSFAAYFLRLLINVHVWSFRKPDSPTPREPQRLPTGIPHRLPEPEIREIQVDQLPNGMPVDMRLTRYRPRHPTRKYPVVMIHGYSASGTTFAHHAVRPSMAEYFFWRGHDVWILDLRTSSGMPTARYPWAFEDAALADLPVAFDEIVRETKCEKVNVFAHCMGSAMFTMAVLAEPKAGDAFYEQRKVLPWRVNRAVLSQIAPVVVMSPANIFRGYAMGYLRHFLPFANYEFRVKPDAGLTDQLIDRLLATLPYPKGEFAAENPPWPWQNAAFAGTRHRMDALYGRDFSLVDKKGMRLLDDAVLEYIDDLFGPLSIDTVAQAIHFARAEVITSRTGRSEYVLPGNILRRWIFKTASIHGTENGLADVATLERFKKRFVEDAGVKIETRPFDDFGHQDGLIGRKREQVFSYVHEFLTREEANA